MNVERYEDRINRAIALIDREIDRELSLERLADEACLSPFHFHRLFSMLTGESVHALTTRMRMQRALALTQRGTRPQWKQIASAVGYRSPDVFARAFKRHYGCTPSQFDLDAWWHTRPDREAAMAVSAYFLRPAPPLTADFEVKIEQRPAASLLLSRAVGAYVDPTRMIAAYDRIRQAADQLGIDMRSRLSGASQDDPELVPLSRCRYDFALEVPLNTPVPKGLLGASRREGRWTGFIALIFPIIGAYLLARHAPTSGLSAALRQGASFGLSGGLISGAAIYTYFTWTNPNFTIEGQKVDAAMQAFVSLSGALILGIVMVPVMQAFRRRRGTNG